MNKKYFVYCRRGSPVFVPRDDVPAALLPGQQLKAFLLADDLDDVTHHKLKHLADEGKA